MAGLFDTFGIATKGLNVQQANINTTSHNISNSSTTGYSRQRAVIQASRPFGGASRWDTFTAGQVGTGAEVTTIQRIRDYFKDYQVRTQTTSCNTLQYQNEYLTKVDDILGESSDTGIQAALSDFYKKFQTLSTDPVNSRTVAVESAATLASKLNSTYNQIEDQKEDAQGELNTDVTQVNTLLDQVNSLNKQISNVTALGMSPNDLMDARDNCLDQLSAKFGITVDREKYETMDVTTSLGGNTLTLVDGKDLTGANCNRLSYVTSAELDATGANLKVSYAVLGDKNNIKTITINGAATDKATLQGIADKLMQNRILVGNKDGIVSNGTGAGQINGLSAYDASGNATISLSDYNNTTNGSSKVVFAIDNGKIGGEQIVQNDIQNTMNQLDKLAAALAYTVNAIQTGTTDGSADADLDNNNEPLFVNSANNSTSVAAANKDAGITAKNITINNVINNDKTKLNCGATSLAGTGDGKRALAIATTLNLTMDLTNFNVTAATTRASFFSTTGLSFEDNTTNGGRKDLNLKSDGKGLTLNNFFKDTVVGTLATKNEGIESDRTNAENQLTIYEDDRTSTSGVSLDEETANLIQYQHAYSANAKVISTVDELLDVVINGLKK